MSAAAEAHRVVGARCAHSKPLLIISDAIQAVETAIDHVQAEAPAKWVTIVWASAIICFGIVACFLLMSSMCCSA